MAQFDYSLESILEQQRQARTATVTDWSSPWLYFVVGVVALTVFYLAKKRRKR